MADFKSALIAAMTEAGIVDIDERAMIAAIAGGESGFQPHTEVSYGHTENDRIRMIFSVLRDWNDADLDDLKSDDVAFFNQVYGGRYGNAPGSDDGYTYRGRGPFQLTFKDNYAAIGKAIGRDLAATPDLVNDLDVGALTVVAYVHQRYKGGGFQEMLNCVGYNTPDIAERKNALYAQFRASGEFNA